MKTDIGQIKADLAGNFDILRQHILAQSSVEAESSLYWVETFCAIAIRVIERSNPSKLRDAAMTEEIKARIKGQRRVDE